MKQADELKYESLQYAPRYYIQTAKNNIESLAQVAGEAGSNSDEAIGVRARRDKVDDVGKLQFGYDPDLMVLDVGDDGCGMTAETMRKRLKFVGAQPNEGAKRGFFHRGIRETFVAMGGGEVYSIGLNDAGDEVYSHAKFDAERGMGFEAEDKPVSAEVRALMGVPTGTGTLVRIPMRRFATKKPKQFTFPAIKSAIENCVQIRPMLLDPNREVSLRFGEEPPRRIEFTYDSGESLIEPTNVTIAGLEGTFWVKAADGPIKGGGTSKQNRRHGILIRGERAAYEVSLGEKHRANPAMNRVFGELRLDGIEKLQREEDAKADDDAQLVYKADRSGLNPEHTVVEAIINFIDTKLGPLVTALENQAPKKEVTRDMRRHLQKLAQLINQVVQGSDFPEVEDPDAPEKTKEPKDNLPEHEPPDPPNEVPVPVVDDGLAFSRSRIFMDAGQSRTVKLWIDTDVIATGTPIEKVSVPDDVVKGITLSRKDVPSPSRDAIAEVNVTIGSGASEGRHELKVRSGGYEAILPVHVRYARASGFITQIIPVNEDWEQGSAFYNPATGQVSVYVGRPEFKDVEKRARREKVDDPWKFPLYRQLVVESIREAALLPAAERAAEVAWDDLSPEERKAHDAFHKQVSFEFNQLDYQLRAKLHQVFLDAVA